MKKISIENILWALLVLAMGAMVVALWGLVLGRPEYKVNAQEGTNIPAMQFAGEQALDNGILLSSVAQLDGGNVVVSLSEGDAAWHLVITQVGVDGLTTGRVSLPWSKPETVTIATAGARLHVTVGWTDGHISAYSWEFGAPFSREWSQYIPVAVGQ